jgi:hypothetical protein
MADHPTTTALKALIAHLSNVMPSSELDDIDLALNGPVDSGTGSTTAAMDRILRRDQARVRIATDAKAVPVRNERFPHANRLVR